MVDFIDSSPNRTVEKKKKKEEDGFGAGGGDIVGRGEGQEHDAA